MSGAEPVGELATVLVTHHGPAPVARISGEIDLSNADGVRERLAVAVDPAAPGLVVDLAETMYLDSAGIRMLGQLLEELQARRQELVVVAPPGSRAARLFQVAMLHGVLPIADDVAGAVAALT